MEFWMRMKSHSFFPSDRMGLLAGLAVAALLAATPTLIAQQDAPVVPPTAQSPQTTTPPAKADATLTTGRGHTKKSKVAKDDRVQETKDTKVALKKEAKYNPLVGKDQQLPDKQLYDKAMTQVASGHYDIGRLDLQTLLDTYPDSQYMMRSKLAVADAWYKEGGSAALAEAEQEYRDFITFFPNVPEAAEAQLRIGDIFFKQMDVPDRDYSKGTHAEQEYRTMLKQYPDAPKPVLDEARQKLREVQEVLADREAELGAFYATHANWAAAIARYQTVVDTYPLYSHMDDVLIGIGDGYEAQAATVRDTPVCSKSLVAGTRCIPEGPKARLLEEYDGKAADDYRRVVLYHSSAPHVEDAKERLTGMNLPIPTPTKEEEAASDALESSRAQYNLQKRIELLFLHSPDTVTSARIGLPTLEEPTRRTAPAVVKELQADFASAFNPNLAKHAATESAEATKPTDADSAAPTPAAAAAPPTLEDVTNESTAGADDSKTVTVVTPTAPSSGGGTGLGVDIITPGADSNAPAKPASDLPAAVGAQDPNYGLPTPKATTTALPPVEKAADAPDQINDVAGKTTPAAQAAPAADGKKGKKTKMPKIDKNDESSSKKKPKKGLDKLNPF